MDKTRLDAAIVTYQDLFKADPEKATADFKERDERAAEYRSYTKERLLNLNLEELVEYLGKLWALRMWGNKRYQVEKIVENNGGIDELLKQIAGLLYGDGSLDKRWDHFVGNVKGLGSAAASELLAYNSPSEVAIFNGTTVRALTYLGVPLKAKYEYQRDSSCLRQVCDASKELLAEMQKAGIPAENLLAVDYFLWDTVRPIVNDSEPDSKEGKPVPDAPDKAAAKQEKSYHSEVQSALEEIGSFLGFESSTEVKVATGAVVDTVWEATIGNMGKVIYVFEVQSSGSIDSLILNLKKAQSNPAVQAIVAVSDEVQLQKIEEESKGVIAEGVLKTWVSEDVLATRDHLSAAHESINALALVPESFR